MIQPIEPFRSGLISAGDETIEMLAPSEDGSIWISVPVPICHGITGSGSEGAG